MSYHVSRYREKESGTIVEAYQVSEGTSVDFINSYNEREVAEAGDFVLVYPYTERVDEESFNRDYERVGHVDE